MNMVNEYLVPIRIEAVITPKFITSTSIVRGLNGEEGKVFQ